MDKEMQGASKIQNAKEADFPEPGKPLPLSLCFEYLWHWELLGNKSALLLATKFVAICHNSHNS